MTAPTPAVERAAEAITRRLGSSGIVTWGSVTAQEALTAALTDPDDPDSLARTLWVLDRAALGGRVDPDLFDHATSRKHWRAVADGLRMMLTGQDS